MTITLTIAIDVDETSNLDANPLFTEFIDILEKAQSKDLPVRITFNREPTFVPVDIKRNPYYQMLVRMVKK